MLNIFLAHHQELAIPLSMDILIPILLCDAAVPDNPSLFHCPILYMVQNDLKYTTMILDAIPSFVCFIPFMERCIHIQIKEDNDFNNFTLSLVPNYL